MSALLEVRDLAFRYPGQDLNAVDGVDLEIEAGAMVGIVGESGSGKTTLGRLLVGALAPSAGAVAVDGASWMEIDRRDPRRRCVQMVFQDPYAALNPWRTAREAVAEVLQVWGADRDARWRRADELLAEVGLSGDATRRLPRQLSGGQCQRVGIARALAADPAVLVADEPTSSLDVSVQAQILNLLTRLKRERDLALVLISHDLSVVRYATDRAIVMYAGGVVERGLTDELLSDPRHPYTRILVDAIPGREGELESVTNAAAPPDGCRFAGSCPFVADACLAERPRLLPRPDREYACVRGLPASGTNGHSAERQISKRIG